MIRSWARIAMPMLLGVVLIGCSPSKPVTPGESSSGLAAGDSSARAHVAGTGLRRD